MYTKSLLCKKFIYVYIVQGLPYIKCYECGNFMFDVIGIAWKTL